MKTTRSRKPDWPRKVSIGRVSVSIYQRSAPNGSPGFMVADCTSKQRKFISHASEANALETARPPARRLLGTGNFTWRGMRTPRW